ncbi:2-dehydro-3-deoxygalactonokinase [Pseudorhodobacter sp.]|uniref:2-dehydro-3-deoxygalactonokinase n=1 Tax=Pseudorhodobacter sp. TaxID=1934400 RepID=UPI002649E619|nr:2-dehydro-3-deoxygalactonokinase [Pseudorhodobacter sp.]MDN5788022.1 2-dehydro-3-deoxygalactonokinase [Pseudorhodobacter sp.]
MMADFVAVDWGTSSFRLWVMARDGRLHGESRGPEGMSHCVTAGFAPVLAAHLARAEAPADLPILICGMAGARQGWFEAPYADLPAPITALAAKAVRLPGHLLADLPNPRDIRILPGLAQRDAAHPDVMRGEETQLFGLANQAIEGLVCLPGTHCKWANLQDGAVTGFASYITGELFDLLSRQSILRHAMPETYAIAPDDPDFLAAADQAMADPGLLTEALFPLRAGQLLDYRGREATQARLSGLLIGAEVGRQVAGNALKSVTLVGQQGLGALYAAVLTRAGLSMKTVDAENASRQGLLAAAREIWRF